MTMSPKPRPSYKQVERRGFWRTKATMRKCKIALGVVLAGLILAGALAYRISHRVLPQRPASRGNAIVGSFHVHSDLSHDSSQTIADIVTAAHVAQLDFIILADHNNQYAGPLVRDGIILLSSAELSTRYGHLISFGAARVPERSVRDASGIYATIRSLGGMPIVAHPTDPKRPWTGAWAEARGLEIANFASSARRHGGPALLGLAPLLAAGLINRDLALAQIYDRDSDALGQWDSNTDPGFVALCGVDAHGWFNLADNLRAWTVVIDGPWPSDENERAAWITQRIQNGRFYCDAGFRGAPSGLHFEARRGGFAAAGPGETTSVVDIDEIDVRVSTPSAGERLVLFKNGLAVANSKGNELHYANPTAGTYRVELWQRLPNLVYDEHVVPVAYSERLRLAPELPATPERPLP
jgi:hypothetical protein